jgi:hypothetical protein
VSTDRDDADAPPDAPAAAAIVTATRQRAESLGLIARALARVAPGGAVVVNGAKADGVDGLMRQVAGAIPLAGSFPKAHGKLFWFARPEALPEAVGGWADGYALRPNDDGFVTGPGMFSPDHVDPGSRRLAAVFDARLSGASRTSAPAGAGSPRVLSPVRRRSPPSIFTRPKLGRSPPRAATSPTLAPHSTGATWPGSTGPGRATTGSSRTRLSTRAGPPSQPRRHLHRGRRPPPEA